MKYLAIIMVLLAFGCATTQQTSVCDTVSDGQSVICDMSKQVGQNVETVAGILKLGNIGALSADLYTAKEADKFLDDTIGHLQRIAETGEGLSYAGAVQYVLLTMSKLSPEAQAMFVVMQDFIAIDSSELLTLFDIQMLLKHLQEQKMIIAPFLVG